MTNYDVVKGERMSWQARYDMRRLYDEEMINQER